MQIECNTEAHHGVKAIAWVGIVVYSFGLVVLFGILIFKARLAILKSKPTALSRAIQFLHGEYRPMFCYWELVEMVRRLLLVGMFVLIKRGSMTQLFFGTVFAAVFLLVQSQVEPFHNTADNFVARTLSSLILIVFVFLIMFKLSFLTSFSQIMMSNKLRDDFDVPIQSLSVALSATVIVGICFALIILWTRVIDEQRLLRHERQSMRQRRLRYEDDATEVKAPTIGSDQYHLFLSQ